MKNYEQMWNDLKKYLQQKLEYHKGGVMQSISEAIHGEKYTEEIIRIVEQIEEDNS